MSSNQPNHVISIIIFNNINSKWLKHTLYKIPIIPLPLSLFLLRITMLTIHLQQLSIPPLSYGPLFGHFTFFPSFLPSIQCFYRTFQIKANSGVDEEAKLKEKHQGLLNEYLISQKECVLKKRKLKETNERKITLLGEIRFLKHRRDFLMKRQLQKSEQEQEIIQADKADTKYNAESSRRYVNSGAVASTSGQATQSRRPPIIPIRNSGSSGKEGMTNVPVNLGKKAKNLVTSGKRAEKRKISWQDQLVLKA